MVISKYQDLSPEEFIRQLFNDTVDGKMKITYYPNIEEKPYDLTYYMTWNEKDAEELVERCNILLTRLAYIGENHKLIEDEEKRKKFMTEEDQSVWETYVKPFEPFEVSEDVINELYFRGEFDQLEDEENELLERHYEWQNSQSLQRLPFERTSPLEMIRLAQSFTILYSMDAPEEMLMAVGRELAEEMAIYYYFDNDKKSDSIVDRIIEGTYLHSEE